MKHTPGPWHAEKHVSMGQELFAVFSEGVHKAPDGIFLGTAGTQPESQANARLIAAAPDGYALAESIVRWYENAGDSDPDQESPGSIKLWRQAKAFLAKARGEA